MLRLCTMPRRPRTTLFPYTTLFRSLTATDGCQQIDDPGGQLIRRGLQLDHLIRERGDQVVEAGPARGLERVHAVRSEEHTSELQSRGHLVCRLLLEKKKNHRFGQGI